ncbi:MAG: hypothetical protein LBK76_02545 [Verrucomicrobiales bacterium]|nr:hypothetical protein [Verrucomicrobiales bacterium]
MAKATANCTCEKCGAEWEVSKHCYNRAAANSFESWAESTLTTCRKCESAAAFEALQKDETPVTIEVKLSCYTSIGGKPAAVLVAKGGTYLRRDALKEAGFGYGDIPLVTGFLDVLRMRSPKAWHKVVTLSLDDATPERFVTDIGMVDGRIAGFKVVVGWTDADMAVYADTVKKLRAEHAVKAAAEKAEAERQEKIGVSPFRKWVAENQGKQSWNEKFYGTDKYGWRVYFSGEETPLPKSLIPAQQAWRKHRDAVNAEARGETVAPVKEDPPQIIYVAVAENIVSTTVNAQGKKIQCHDDGYRVGLVCGADQYIATNTKAVNSYAADCWAILKAVEYAIAKGYKSVVLTTRGRCGWRAGGDDKNQFFLDLARAKALVADLRVEFSDNRPESNPAVAVARDATAAKLTETADDDEARKQINATLKNIQSERGEIESLDKSSVPPALDQNPKVSVPADLKEGV